MSGRRPAGRTGSASRDVEKGSASWSDLARSNDRGNQTQRLLLAVALDQDGIRVDSQDSGIDQGVADSQRLAVEHRPGALRTAENGLQVQDRKSTRLNSSH